MDHSYSDALKEHQSGNLNEAEKLYHSYLKENPDNIEVLHLLGILLAQKQDFLNASYFVERALTIDSDSSTLHSNMGNILLNLEKYDEAIYHYNLALKLQPDNASSHNNLGNVYYRLEKFEEAKKAYHEASLLRPNYVDAHYNLGLVLIKQNMQSEAKKSLELVLSLDPDHTQAHSNLGYLLQTEGDFDLAEKHYRKSLELNQEGELSCHNLGVILSSKGRYEEAIEFFKKVIDLDPKHEEALYNLGAIFLLQKKVKEALPCFLRVAEFSSNDFSVYYNIGIIYLELARYEEAISYFNEALNIAPDNFAANINLGTIYLRLRDFSKAEKYYLKASSLCPDNEEASHILAAIQEKDASSSPASYVQNLFDQYASFFEEHAEVLGCRAPEILFNALYPKFINKECSLYVLDLGCGTGLSGSKFKPFAGRLIGIDLSEKMLELAANKDIYDELILGPIEEKVAEFSDIDLIIASDTLVYFGDLNDLFAKCYAALKEGGLFSFTIEVTDNYPYLLQRSIRFAHSERYIKELASKNNFTLLDSGEAILRKHGDGVVNGVFFIIRK